MCCIVKYLLYLALVLNYVFHLAFSICCIAEHLLYLALVLNLVSDMALPMSCIGKHFLYLSLVLNYVLNWQCGCAELHKTSYIWRLCSTLSFIPHCRCAVCWKPIIFGAGVELSVWFRTADELHCKRPLIFGACGELPLLFGTIDVLHCKKLLYLALICFELCLSFRTAHELHCETPFIFGALRSMTSFVCHLWCGAMKSVLCLALVLHLFYLSLSMCWLASYLFYFALVLICVIYFALWMCAAIPPKCFTINPCFVYCA